MSKFFSVLVLLAASSVQAASFEGRFRVSGPCNIDEFKDAERVYSKFGKSAWTPRDSNGTRLRLQSLQFYIYGSDASQYELFLGKREVLNAMGTDPSKKSPFRWETTMKGNSMFSFTEWKNAKGELVQRMKIWVEVHGDKLSIDQTEIVSLRAIKSRCELTRY